MKKVFQWGLALALGLGMLLGAAGCGACREEMKQEKAEAAPAK